MHTSAPMLGSALLLFCEPTTGEIQSQSVKGLTVEGSFDSRLLVRSDGRRVEVSGNPSRFGRADNVFGLSDLAQCLDLYNSVLRSLGLPEFFTDDRTTLSGEQLQESENVAEWGVRIKRIDLCQGYEAGSIDDARSLVRAMGSVSHAGKVGFVYPDGLTVSWGQGSRWSYSKYYVKGPELLKHLDQGDEYCRQLTKWATDVGLVRHEVSLKAMNLKRNGLDQPAAWTGQQMGQIMRTFRCHQKAGLTSNGWDQICDQLIEKGVSPMRARRAQEAAYAHLMGHQFVIGHNITRATYYRLQADLRKVGVNIGAPLNVSALSRSVRVIELRDASPPAFYRRVGT